MTAAVPAVLLGLTLAAAPDTPSPTPGSSPPPQVLCYVETAYGGIAPEALDLSPCTVVVDAFLIPAASGEVSAANGLPRRPLIRAARANRSRVLVAIGGATVPGGVFGTIARQPDPLDRFLDGMVRFVLDGGYDGVDLDWEFPSPAERGLHAQLARAVRARLESAFAAERPRERPLVVVGVTTGAFLEGYDFPALAGVVDHFVQFGYDFRNPALGPWAHTARLWPDGASSSIEASVRGVATELVRRGVPRDKLIVGLPLYASDGRPWVDVRSEALASTAPLDPLYLESRLPDGAWVTGPEAIEAKARRVLSGSEIAGGAAGGIALWQLGHQGATPDLTRALRRALPAARPGAP